MDAEIFLDVGAVPVHVGVLWPSDEAARGCPQGDIRLSFDPASGFIHNSAFDEGLIDYTLRYDNALHFSPTFRDYEERLAHRLVERYGLRGREIVEIGTGSGRFLGLLCGLGDNRGVGYDPSHDPERADPSLAGRAEVVRDYFSERYADRPADFICCRHVLEHVPDPLGFITSLRRALDAHPETIVYFEVPNTQLILEKLSIWDIIYEHCGYFVPESLGWMFQECGFEILDLHEAYGGQFVGLEARIAAPSREWLRAANTADLASSVASFSARFAAKRAHWQRELAGLADHGERTVVWGGGAKAVSFLNLLQIGDRIEYVVDVNPGKQGSYLAGSAQKIVAPEFLREYRPDVAIVMNPIYREEIEAELRLLSPNTRVVTA